MRAHQVNFDRSKSGFKRSEQ